MASPITAGRTQNAPVDGAAALPSVPGSTHRYVSVNGVRYHYVEAGRGEPLVLIHGFPQNWYMWRKLIPELAKHFRVIVPDMRGAGWSDAPADGYGKAQIADEIAAFMDAVGAPRAKVMGHDWGGFVGFMLALRHPEKVDHYLALNIATPWPTASALPDAWRFLYQPVLSTPVLGAALLRTPGVVRTMLAGASTRDSWSDTDVRMYEQPYRDHARSAAGSAMYRTFLARELLPWARGGYDAQRLQMPTLLLLGGDDPIIRSSLATGIERHGDDAHVEVVPGAGHFLAEERPDAVLSRALEFFRSAS